MPTLVQLARDTDVAGRPIDVRTSGEIGDLSGDIATPLALVVAELLQNAVEHWVHEGGDGSPRVDLEFARDGNTLSVVVRDNGSGFPAGFDIDRTRSLGLAIVRDLVRSQLGGSITVNNDHGAVVHLIVPLRLG